MSSRILVVEHDEAMAKALANALQSEGLDVVVASDGPAALARFDETEPDAVLLSVKLAEESGVDVCQALRVEPRGPLVPILFMGRVDAEPQIRSPGDALSLGGDYFFPLPNDLEYLARRVKGWTTQESGASEAAKEPISEELPLNVAELLDYQPESVTEHGYDTTAPERAPSAVEDAARELVKEGEGLRERGKMKEAMECYSAAAAMYETDGDAKPALALYKLILHLDPSESDVARHAAQLAVSIGARADAIEIYQRAADALEARGQLENATHMIHEILRLDPSNAEMLRRLEELSLALSTGDLEEPEPEPEEPPIDDKASFDDLVAQEIGKNIRASTLDMAMLEPKIPPNLSEIVHRGDLFEGYTSIEPRDLDGDPTKPPDRKPVDFGSIAHANQKTASDVLTADNPVPPAPDSPEGEDVLGVDTIHLLENKKEPIPLDKPKTGDVIPLPLTEQRGEVIPLYSTKRGEDEETVNETDGLDDPTEEPDGFVDLGDLLNAEEADVVPSRIASADEELEDDLQIEEVEEISLDEEEDHFDEKTPMFDGPPKIATGEEAFDEVTPPGALDTIEEPDARAGPIAEADAVEPLPPLPPELASERPAFGGSFDEVEMSAGWNALLEREGQTGANEMTFEQELDPLEAGEVAYGDLTEKQPPADQKLEDLRGWGHDSAKEEPLQAAPPVDEESFAKSPLTMGGWSQLPVWEDISGEASEPGQLSEIPEVAYGQSSMIPASRLVPVEGSAASLVDVVRLLAKIDQQHATGVLEIAGAPRIVFVDGHPAALRGVRAVHSFLGLLMQSRRVDETSCQELMDRNYSERPVEIARLFVRNGLLREAEGTAFLHRHYEDGLTHLLRQHGEWSFDGSEDAEVVREEIVPEVEDVRRVLIDLLPRIASGAELSEAIGGPRARIRVSAIAEDGPSRDARLLGLLDGRYELQEAARLTAMTPERAAAIGFVYVMFGLASVVQRPKRRGHLSWIPLSQPSASEPILSAPPKRQTKREPKPRMHISDVTRPLGDLTPAERIRSLEVLIRESDYFSILGITQDAEAPDVRQAHSMLAALIDEEALVVDPEMLERARVVRKTLDEARDVLSNPELRAAYRQHLK